VTPRIPPVPFGEWPVEITDVVQGIDGSTTRHDESSQRGKAALGTLAHHPALAKRWLEYTTQILRSSSLTDRHREILVLRTVSLRKSKVQWEEHQAVAARCGLDADAVAWIVSGPNAPGWDPLEKALVSSVDELLGEGCISEATWSVLTGHFGVQQLLDLIFTVGAFETNCWMARSFDLDVEPLPDRQYP
jgi:alkylhydroperoxidase family enzyme